MGYRKVLDTVLNIPYNGHMNKLKHTKKTEIKIITFKLSFFINIISKNINTAMRINESSLLVRPNKKADRR